MLLHEVVGTEACRSCQAVGKVDIATFFIVAPAVLGDDFLQLHPKFIVAQRRLSLDRHECSVRTNARLETRRQVEVRPAFVF